MFQVLSSIVLIDIHSIFFPYHLIQTEAFPHPGAILALGLPCEEFCFRLPSATRIVVQPRIAIQHGNAQCRHITYVLLFV